MSQDDDLLVRWAHGSTARRVLRQLVTGDQGVLIRATACPGMRVLWVGDVLIRDAVPLAACVLDVTGADVRLDGFVASTDRAARVLAGRLADRCAHAGYGRLLIPERQAAAIDDTAIGEAVIELIAGRHPRRRDGDLLVVSLTAS